MTDHPLQLLNFILLLVVVVSHMILCWFLDQRVKSLNPQIWATELGSPTLLNQSPATTFKFLGFYIFSARYKSLNDPVVDRLTIIVRCTFWTVLLLLVAGWIGVFVV